MDSRLLKKYYNRAKLRDWEPHNPRCPLTAAVVIPVLAELDYLPRTLQSLAANLDVRWSEVAIFLVINSSPETEKQKVFENELLLQKLRECDPILLAGLIPGKNLFWLDANSVGFQVKRSGGVGAARKLAMDSCLPFFDMANSESEPLFFCLDADTLVSDNYICQGINYFAETKSKAATFNFIHSDGKEEKLHDAIVLYELFMRYYQLALRLTGSPYAFTALGSAIAVTAETYVRVGGMRERSGGEDFYFLQAVSKFTEVGEIKAATVFPSARSSDRVPFGTGPKIRSIAQNGELLFYHPELFSTLQKMYNVVNSINCPEDFDKLPTLLDDVSLLSARFLEEFNFKQAWQKILKNTPRTIKHLARAFNVWFDAFKILKFIHFAEETFQNLQRVSWQQAFEALPALGFSREIGLLKSPHDLLAKLRQI